MQNPFSTQPELFVTSADLEHPSLQGLDGAEAVLDWTKLEHLMADFYAAVDILALCDAAGRGIYTIRRLDSLGRPHTGHPATLISPFLITFQLGRNNCRIQHPCCL